mmetsp:Transcript_48879/g.130845  ORF Transcript_48879/g.130845 Transcript_48879/m.130845 type:complete len:236 (-) Transcript_48879:28-735(-)
MAVREGTSDLLRHPPDEALVAPDLREPSAEGAAEADLGHDVDVPGVFEGLQEAQDVGMVQLAEYGNLRPEAVDVGTAHGELLHRHLLRAAVAVLASEDTAKGAAAELVVLVPHKVVVDVARPPASAEGCAVDHATVRRGEVHGSDVAVAGAGRFRVQPIAAAVTARRAVNAALRLCTSWFRRANRLQDSWATGSTQTAPAVRGSPMQGRSGWRGARAELLYIGGPRRRLCRHRND